MFALQFFPFTCESALVFDSPISRFNAQVRSLSCARNEADAGFSFKVLQGLYNCTPLTVIWNCGESTSSVKRSGQYVRHVNMQYPVPVMWYLKRSSLPYFLLKRKGISTFPLADFGHRQLYALLKHFIAFLVFGRTTSPSSRKSVDPIRKKNAFWSVWTSSHFCVCQRCVSYDINGFYYAEQLHLFCEKLMLSCPCNIPFENSPLFILRIVSLTSSMSDFSTEISNQWKQSTSYTTVFSHWQTVLYLFDLVC